MSAWLFNTWRPGRCQPVFLRLRVADWCLPSGPRWTRDAVAAIRNQRPANSLFLNVSSRVEQHEQADVSSPWRWWLESSGAWVTACKWTYKCIVFLWLFKIQSYDCIFYIEIHITFIKVFLYSMSVLNARVIVPVCITFYSLSIRLSLRKKMRKI